MPILCRWCVCIYYGSLRCLLASVYVHMVTVKLIVVMDYYMIQKHQLIYHL
jgi:hypothetical protein